MDNTSQQIDDWAAAVVTATDWAQVRQIWQTIPLAQEDAVLDAVAQRAAVLAQAGDERSASRAQIWHAELRHIQRKRDEHPPYVAAIQAFLQAADETAARRVFAAHQVVLQPYEAQVWLDRRVADATEEKRAHLTARAALLRTLRGVAPVAPVVVVVPPVQSAPTPITTVHGDLNQAGGNIYQHSVHIEVSDHGMFINNMVVEQRWQRPSPPSLLWDTIPRTHDLQQVKRLLGDRGQVAISGPTAAAVQGMPGIGKTTLARQLARDLDAHYPDGVLWQEIGPQISADQVQRILNQWAQVALLLPPALDNIVQFDPGAVRALFRDRRLLVILDDVWSLNAVRPLREALPDGAHLILTTRLETVTVGLGGGEHVLGILTPEEARALISLRLGWPVIPAAHQPWCDALAQGVGYHTLALDVALGVLRLKGRRPEAWQQTAIRLVETLRTGQGFDDLQIPDGDREQHVERVLAYSYERMDAVAQGRFCLLGALAEGASWATTHIAQLWQCDEQTALDQMDTLVNAALLSRTEQRDRWQQHSLLRGYALALLRRAGAAEAASAQHAAIYDAAMQQADAAQHHHTMLPDYPQVRHAVQWAIANDLARAQNLISNAANLQAAFGFVRENLVWSLQVRDIAQQRGTAADVARAHMTVGNALQRAASLPGEDRGERLRESLGAYEAALAYRRPETAPLDYAATENNRGIVLHALAEVPGEDRGERLRESLGAYAAALAYRRPETAPLDYAMTENNRGNVLIALAEVPGEDRGLRLREALGAYEAALVYLRPETAPLDYAATETGRGVVLSDLASLAGEDRGLRLREALGAYAAALVYRRPETAPLDYAATENNLGNVLRALAEVPGEDRGLRLREALGAYAAALAYRRPETAPLDYAMTETNRGNVLRDLAEVPGEDRGLRLREALGAYEAALAFYRPETAPLAYAATETGRGNVLRALAEVPGEDRGLRLREALGAYEAALAFYRPETAPLAYAMTENNLGNVLSDLASLPGEDRGGRLREALGAYEAALAFYRPETAPLAYAMTENNLGNVLSELADLPGEDRGGRLREALHALWTAFTAFTDLGHEPYQQRVARQLRWQLLASGRDFLRAWEELDLGRLPDWLEPRADPPITGTPLLDAFLASASSEELNAFWQQVPLEEEQLFLDMVEQAFTEAAHAGNSALAAQLGERRDALHRRTARQQVQQTLVVLQAIFDAYCTRFENAERDDAPSSVWREVVAAGELLLEPPFAGMGQVPWTLLYLHLGTAYHHLGIALHREGDAHAAVVAYDRALQLQPDTVFWLWSRAAALIDRGALDEAAADLAQARALEPDAPDLAALDARLTQARKRQHGGS